MHGYNLIRKVRRAFATNVSTTSFTAKVPTIVEPVNDGVLDLTHLFTNLLCPKRVKLWPIGLGSNDDAFSMKVIGWHQVLLDGSKTLWFPTPIGEFACIISSAAPGVALAAVIATEFFADTITPVASKTPDRVIAAGTAVNSDVEIESPADGTIAHIVLPIRGFEKLEFTFDETTGTPACNVLYAFV